MDDKELSVEKAKEQMSQIIEYLRKETKRISSDFMAEAALLGPEEHHRVCEERNRQWSIERDKYHLEEKILALGLSPELESLVMEEKMNEFNSYKDRL